jgi:hypothetical protein
LALALFVAPTLGAQIQMPDPKQMSGIPRPVDDLPTGSISVRLIRGDLSNNITNYPVELHIGDKVQTVKTDDAGRAQFDHLNPGATLKAVAVVDGERLESQEFPMPAQGGIRVMLVATDREKAAKAAAAAAAPAIAGDVVLGEDSRIVMEPGDETIEVFYLLTIQNGAGAPVSPSKPFVFDLPKGASPASVLEGSTPLAHAEGSRVRVEGPFPPGPTQLQVGFALPITSSSLDVTQVFPANLQHVEVIVRKVGAVDVQSRQFEDHRDITANGDTAVVGEGRAVSAGQPLELTLSGLPHHSTVPRWIALGLAMAIAFVGVWTTAAPDDADARRDERKGLIARREKLFQELVRLENDRRNGRGDRARYAGRREELIGALEQIYGALDNEPPAAA